MAVNERGREESATTAEGHPCGLGHHFSYLIANYAELSFKARWKCGRTAPGTKFGMDSGKWMLKDDDEEEKGADEKEDGMVGMDGLMLMP